MPNGGFNYNVYDSADRLTLSQDADQRTLNLWGFTKYDALSREILSGELTNPNSRSTLQSQFDTHTTLSEVFDSSKPEQLYYSNNSFPFGVDSSKAMEVNYYDSYTTWRNDSFLPWNSYYTNTKGLLTGTFKRYTENRKWLREVFYHDTKDRVTESKKQNINGDVERLTTAYRLRGDIYDHTHIFNKNSSSIFYSNMQYIYGRGERKQEYRFHISNYSEYVNFSTKYNYNEIGQLITKQFQPDRQYEAGSGQDYINRPPALGEPNKQDIANKAIIIADTFVADANDSNTGTYLAEIDTTQSNGQTDALQTINYGYNIRGQLNCINCRNKQVWPNPKENDLFSMKLAFEDDNR